MTSIREDAPLVILGLPTWDGPYEKAICQLAKRLAKYRRVIYVEYAQTVLDALRGKPGAVLGNSGLREPAGSPRQAALWVLTPRAIPALNGLPDGVVYETLRRMSESRVRADLHAALARLGIVPGSFVLVNAFAPHLGAGRPRGWWGEIARFYYRYDDIGGQPWNARHGVKLEEMLLRDWDGVIATSTLLAKKSEAVNKRVALVPNGADTALFGEALRPGPVAPELATAPCPVVGYLGSLDSRVDIPMLTAVARAMPDVTFALIGPEMPGVAPLEELRGLGNVKLLGARKPDQLPPYLRVFKTGMIPFVRNRFTECIYPIKVNEYLAAGIPVVRTRFSELPGFEGIVQDCEPGDARSFVECVRTAIRQSENPALREQRRTVAARADWDGRAAEFNRVLGVWVAELRG